MYGYNILLVVLMVTMLGDCEGKRTEKGNLQSQFDDVRSLRKRNLIQFALMISCTTGRSAFDFNNYGNYCGWGGSGNPVDDIDRCCQAHDQCYGRNSADDCLPKYVPYDSGFIKQWRSSVQKCVIQCDDAKDSCKKKICECDRICAECFAKYPYNSNHKKSWWGRRRK